MKKLMILLLLVFGIMEEMDAVVREYSLKFDPANFKVEKFEFEGRTYKVRAYENIVYVAYPVDTAYQKMNIYVPEEYFHGKKINNFSAKDAPIFFPNSVGGYMPASPMGLNNNGDRNVFGQRRGQGTRPQMPAQGNMKKGSAIHYALSRGFIVASAGARGRSLKNSQGIFTGKAPAGLVDLKAAVCYLRYNDKLIPGNKEHIISNGTSAGGAMSTLLGATGNNEDYRPYLDEIGAANASDHIYAVSAYCPITNLNHADCAYEWQFNGVNTYENMMMDMIEGRKPNGKEMKALTAAQQKTSDELKVLFPMYLNSLNLKDKNGKLLMLDEQGEGNFKQYVISFVLASAQSALDKGEDLSSMTWLKVENLKAVGLDFKAYIEYMKRMKTPPAFDAFDLSAPENHLFGTVSIPAQHFTEFSYKNAPTKGPLAVQKIINMMNPMHYIEMTAPRSWDVAKKTDIAQYWHIRYGSIDNNTSLAIEVILATLLENKGYDVDFAIAWNRPHMGDYDLKELFDWIEDALKH